MITAIEQEPMDTTASNGKEGETPIEKPDPGRAFVDEPDPDRVGDVELGTDNEAQTRTRRIKLGLKAIRWERVLTCGILPAIALSLALALGYLKWQDATTRLDDIARTQSVADAKDSTVALLSYRPDTVEKDLTAAQGRLTGSFRDAYAALIRDVVIPGAQQKKITAVATAAAAASVTATENHAVVLVFVDQTTTIGADAPTTTTSAVRVTLDKSGGRWLISAFTPV